MTDGRLTRYRVTADVTARTSEVVLASSAESAAEIHENTVGLICDDLGVDLEEFALLEVANLGGGSGGSESESEGGNP